MAVSKITKHPFMVENPITIKQDVQDKVSILRNHCARMGNVFQFSLVLTYSAVYNGQITEPGAFPIPKTFDSSVSDSMVLIDMHSVDNGRLRIRKDGAIQVDGVTKTGSTMYAGMYIIDD